MQVISGLSIFVCLHNRAPLTVCISQKKQITDLRARLASLEAEKAWTDNMLEIHRDQQGPGTPVR
jgi:hypothetical protein